MNEQFLMILNRCLSIEQQIVEAMIRGGELSDKQRESLAVQFDELRAIDENVDEILSWDH